MDTHEFVHNASGARVTVAADSRSAALLNRHADWSWCHPGGDLPVQDEATETHSEAPPRVGAGSSRDAWAAYAEHLGFYTTGLSRAQIIEQIDG